MIEEPNLECSKCSDRFNKTKEVPLCRTDRGCPIYPLASSLRIHRLIMGYMNYKRMNLGHMPDFLQMKCLEDSGILKIGYELLIALEGVYNEYMSHERENAEERARLEQLRNEEKRGR